MTFPQAAEESEHPMWTLLHTLFRRSVPNPETARATESAAPVHGQQPDLLRQLRNEFQGSDDVRFHPIQLAASGLRGAVVYVEGLTDSGRVEEAVLRPLIRWAQCADPAQAALPDDLSVLRERVVTGAEVEEVANLEDAVAAVLEGEAVVAFAGAQRGLRVASKGWQARGVQDPIVEVTIRGPRDSFTENLFWNTALIRRRVKDPHLRVTIKKIGRRTRTAVAVLYIEGIASPTLVEEIKKRLGAIDIDGILDTGYIEQLIEDKWYSPFPQHLKTERPDRAVACLLEGRAVLIADTTPFVLMMPATLDSFFHSPEDSYDRFFPVNLLRSIRFAASVMSVIMPALYVALVAYHPGLLPTELALRIAASREGVAFPVLVEALIMQFFLELIKEAGLRLPGPLGQTFGIVGGLILGEVGIRAGLVSEAMVITVAATGIASFASVDREMGTVLRLLGLPIMLSAAIFGLYGLIMALLLVAIHLSTLRSYGIPYFAPYPYYTWSDLKDTVVKGPLRSFHRRPVYMDADDQRRMRDRSGSRPGRGRN